MDTRIACIASLMRTNHRIRVFVALELALLVVLFFSSDLTTTVRSNFEERFPKSPILFDIFEMAFYEVVVHLFKYLGNILQYACEYEIEVFVSHYLFQNTQDACISDFLKTKPEEHYTSFLIRKKAFVKFTSLLIFAMPMNLFSVAYETTMIVSSRRNSFFATCLSGVMLILIYLVILLRAVLHRHKLRNVYNQRKIEKNRFGRQIFDAFEAIKADSREDSVLKLFNTKLSILSRDEFRYLAVSEVYRFVVRFSVLVLKIPFILLKILDPDSINLRMIISRINVLNKSLLSLRNDCFMLMEYWNEFNVSSAQRHTATKPFRLIHCIAARNMCLVKKHEISPRAIASAFVKDGTGSNQNVYGKCDAGANNSQTADHDMHHLLDAYLAQNNIQITTFQKACFLIPAAKKTLILGGAGSGKSLILKAVLGIHQCEGQIAFDDCEISQTSPESIFHNMSYLSQCQYIFNKSISFNILYGTGISIDEAVKSLRFFGLLDYFRQFRNGLGTIVGDKSSGLSNGQKQFICFCRCILKRCNVYLLDEPSNFLDDSSEELIYSVINNLKGKTVIVASSFASRSKDFDAVITINK